MNTENFQEPQFNHEEWMNRLFQFIRTVQYFTIELFQTFKTLLQKGLLQVWKEIRSATSKLSPVDFFFRWYHGIHWSIRWHYTCREHGFIELPIFYMATKRCVE